MRGHFLSQTRRLNRHYQSGGGGWTPPSGDPTMSGSNSTYVVDTYTYVSLRLTVSASNDLKRKWIRIMPRSSGAGSFSILGTYTLTNDVRSDVPDAIQVRYFGGGDVMTTNIIGTSLDNNGSYVPMNSGVTRQLYSRTYNPTQYHVEAHTISPHEIWLWSDATRYTSGGREQNTTTLDVMVRTSGQPYPSAGGYLNWDYEVY